MDRAGYGTYRKYLENRGFRPKHDLNVSMIGYTVTVEPFGPTTAGYWYVRAGKDLDKRLRGRTQKTVIEKLEELGRLDYFVEHHQERIEFHELNVEFYQCSNWKAVRPLDLGLPSWRLYDNGQSDHCGIFPRT